MSIVGYNLLNQALNEHGLQKPDLILNSVNMELTKTLHQAYEESAVKDGMDISLCALDPVNRTLEYAAAYNPLYLVRAGKLEIINGDKFPVGAFVGETMHRFTLKTVSLKERDMIYIFTDGYADQFGGPKGKKFKYKQLQDLLIGIHTLSLDEQHRKLDSAFREWKGDLEQIDDICLIGVRV